MKKFWSKVLLLCLALLMAFPSYAPAFVYAEEGPVTEVVEGIEEDEETDEDEEDDGEEFTDDEMDAVDEEDEEEDSEDEDITLLEEEDEEGIEESEEPNFNVAEIEDVILFDQLKNPEVVVTNEDGVQLKEDTDYTVDYVDTDNVGIATAIIRGIGNYSGEVYRHYRICNSIENKSFAKVDTIPQVVYNGKVQEPSVVIRYNGEVLTEGVDYTLEYSNNINAGLAHVVINGIGEYTGERTASFRIAKAENKITAKNIKVVYSLKEQKVNLNASALEGAALSYNSSHFRNKITAAGVVTVEPQYMWNNEIKITAAETQNYKKTTKTIKLKGVIKSFPYLTDAHVYSKVSTTAKAAVKLLRNHKKTVIVNFKIKSKDKNQVRRDVVDYINNYWTKAWPVEMKYSSKTGAFKPDMDLSLLEQYNGYVYGSLVFKPKYRYTKAKEQSYIKGIVSAAKPASTSDTEKVKLKKIYTWLTKNIRYAYKSDGTPDIYVSDCPTETYRLKKGVCHDYADLMAVMCRVAGLECKHVKSATHAWNIVKMGKKWYQCDSCWDAGNSAANWKYYLKAYTSTWKKDKHHVLLSKYLNMDGVTLAK